MAALPFSIVGIPLIAEFASFSSSAAIAASLCCGHGHRKTNIFETH